MFDTDVLILGGGPAGSAAAITAANAGLRVTLIEREEFPRSVPGESVHPGIQPLLKQLGVETSVLKADFLRFPGHIVRRNGIEQFIPFGEDEQGQWLGFQLWRATFDQILLERARELGVTVYQSLRTKKPLMADGRMNGVMTSAGPIHARHVIDATGRWRALSRMLDLKWDQHGQARTAWYGYATGNVPALDEFPLLTIHSEGWNWIARVRPDTFAWTSLRYDNIRPAMDWIPPELKSLQSRGPIAGANVTWQLARHPAAPGYFLVGDAAAIVDPSTGHGILKAIMSGIHSAFLISLISRKTISEKSAYKKFSDWTHQWFLHDIHEIQTRFSSVDNSTLEQAELGISSETIKPLTDP